MPRGRGHSQRRGDTFRSQKNIETVFNIRAKLFENLLGAPVHTSDDLDDYINQLEAQVLGPKPASDLAAAVIAAESYESDPFLFESLTPFFSTYSEELEPLEVRATISDVHRVEPRQETYQTSEPLPFCDDQHTVTVSSFVEHFNHLRCRKHTISYGIGDVVRQCSMPYSKHEHCEHTRDIQHQILKCSSMLHQMNYKLAGQLRSNLPPELVDMIEDSLSCREKFLLMLVDGIPRRGCGVRRTIKRTTPTDSRAPPIFGCPKPLTSCICSSILYRRPYLLLRDNIKWAIAHATFKTRTRLYMSGNCLHIGRM